MLTIYKKEPNGKLRMLSQDEASVLRYNPHTGKVERLNIHPYDSYTYCNLCEGQGCPNCCYSGFIMKDEIVVKNIDNSLYHEAEDYICLLNLPM